MNLLRDNYQIVIVNLIKTNLTESTEILKIVKKTTGRGSSVLKRSLRDREVVPFESRVNLKCK